MSNCSLIYYLIALGLFQKGLGSVVQTDQTVMAAVGEEAHLRCQLPETKDVLQVTWQKVLPDQKNLTTCNNISQTIDSEFQEKVEFKYVGLQNSSIVIRNVTEQDEGCYLCLFNCYPEGDVSATTCLQVYELHEPILQVRESNSSEESVVSCSVTARPAPTVTLTVTQQHLNFLHSNTSTVTNTNATVTVSTTVTVSGFHGNGAKVRCAGRVLSGPQKEVFMNITVDRQTVVTVAFATKSSSTNHHHKYLMSFGFLAAVFIVLLILRYKKSLIHKMKKKPATEDPTEAQISLMKQKSRKKPTKAENQQSNNPKPDTKPV